MDKQKLEYLDLLTDPDNHSPYPPGNLERSEIRWLISKLKIAWAELEQLQRKKEGELFPISQEIADMNTTENIKLKEQNAIYKEALETIETWDVDIVEGKFIFKQSDVAIQALAKAAKLETNKGD